MLALDGLSLSWPLIAILFVILVALVFIYIFISGDNSHFIMRFEKEKYYEDPTDQPASKHLFPTLYDAASVELSVIIPAYNEEARLPTMLVECIDFLEARCLDNPTYSYEIIVVDDGSTDQTSKIALDFCKKLGTEKLRVLTLVKNRGKGGAVRLGMLSARGKFLLFADADGATKFCDIAKLEIVLERLCKKSDNCLAIGSRAHMESQAVASRSGFRTFLMFGFHALVWIFGVRHVRDTQCGFKLFTRKSALSLFTSLHVERWAFDVELLYIAHCLKMEMREIPVNWTEIEGSKLVPFWSWLQMGIDLVSIWLKYQTRLWIIQPKKSQ